ncbi:HEXXH motif-containing putative peptide modification protein [Micromonospora sp. NPDC049301]|uniref:aKG-HExxH-type peptide beta-hydroxylase n=1 Tax=Micromonospora sp. NPDC049301 TaxID=3155723 RepID=UPI00342E88A6
MSGPLSGAQFAGLAGGHGDPDALDVLRGGQLGRRRLLTVAAARAYGDDPLVRRGLDLLTRAERADPAAVAGVLAHPPLTGWARAAIGRTTDPGYLATLAAAAATRAGLAFELTLPCPDGTLLLPTLGGAVGLAPGPTVVSARHGTARIIQRDGPVRWLPVRRMTPAAGVEVTIDDQDPWRRRYHHPPAPRLADDAAADLDRLTGRAWRWLHAHLPAHADGLAGLLRSLVPLRPPPSGHAVSATSRDALGAIALSVPAEPKTLALLLVHELQHTKLGALLDLVPLHHPGPARYRAPWRLDPRPASALLQGAYAHLGVAEVWRCRRAEGVGAAFEYAYWREQTARAARQLAGASELTDAGRSFLAGMTATLRGWRDPVDEQIEAAVRDVADGGAVRWGLANLSAHPDEVDRAVRAWRRDEPRPDDGPPPTVTPGPATPALPTDTGPESAVRRRLLDAGTEPSTMDRADRAYAGGDPVRALEGYRRRLGGDPEDTDAWVGLALAAARTGHPAAARALATRPDLVRAVHRALPDADLLAVAAWCLDTPSARAPRSVSGDDGPGTAHG